MWNENLDDIVVVKRSGQRVNFNASKIAVAIKKGFEAVYDNPKSEDVFNVFENVLTFLNENYKDRKTINVEDIQDIIENSLKKQNYIDVYNAYHNYRERRMASRQVFSEKQQHKFVRAMEKLNEEENKLGGAITPKETLIKFGSIVASEYVKSYILDSKISRALEEGSIYIHNLDYFYLGYISKLNLKITPEENDNDLTKFIKEIEDTMDEVSDEICISNIDEILDRCFLESYKNYLINYLEKYLTYTGFIDYIPLRRYADTIKKSDSVELINNSIKELSTNEILFRIINSSIKDAEKDLCNFIKNVVNKIWNIKNKRTKLTISITNTDSYIKDIFRKELISIIDASDYNDNIHVTFDVDDNSLDIINDLVSKNISIKFNSSTVFRDGIRLDSGEDSGVGKMVSAATSINMTRIALKCKNKSIKEFYDRLDSTLELAKNALLLEFETLGNKYKENYETLFNNNVLGDERLEHGQKIRKIIKSGTLNVGLIGLYECVSILDNNSSTRFKTLMKILEHIYKKCETYKEEYKLNFVLFEPSDKKSLKELIDYDKSIYSLIKDVTDKENYSYLSTHLNNEEIVSLGKYLQGGYLVSLKLINKEKILDIIRKYCKSGINHITMERGSS